jgi:hypothetical protein
VERMPSKVLVEVHADFRYKPVSPPRTSGVFFPPALSSLTQTELPLAGERESESTHQLRDERVCHLAALRVALARGLQRALEVLRREPAFSLDVELVERRASQRRELQRVLLSCNTVGRLRVNTGHAVLEGARNTHNALEKLASVLHRLCRQRNKRHQ